MIINPKFLRSHLGFLILIPAIFGLGCSGEVIPELAEVNGVLTMHGEPMDGVMVKFLPDPEEGNMGQPSQGLTDAEGNFVLIYDNKKDLKGAAIGVNRIILVDVKSDEARDNPFPYRFKNIVLEAGKTPLKEIVKEGTNKFEIDISQYSTD